MDTPEQSPGSPDLPPGPLETLAIDLAALPASVSLQDFLLGRLMSLSGAFAATFADYDPVDRVLRVTHVYTPSALLVKISELLGMHPTDLRIPVDDARYEEIVANVIGVRGTLPEVTFGAISRPVGRALKLLLGADRFLGVAFVTEGQLYGTAVLMIKAGTPDPSWQLLSSLAHLAAISLRRRRAEDELRSTAEHLRLTLEGVVAAIGLAAEQRDPYTAGHERRVAELALAIGQRLGLRGEDLVCLRYAAHVHDVGMIGVPGEILSKPGRLSDSEFPLVQGHSQAGYEILRTIRFGRPVAEMVREHHERLDGSGYPRALRGDDIMLEARILAVSDVTEAMTSHRPYRETLSLEAALAEIRDNAVTKYDPDVVAACLAAFGVEGFSFSS